MSDNGFWARHDVVDGKPRFAKLGDVSPTEFVEFGDDAYKTYNMEFSGLTELSFIKEDLFSGLGEEHTGWALSKNGEHAYFATSISNELCVVHYVLSAPYDFSTMADAGDTLHMGLTSKQSLTIDISPDGYRIIIAYQNWSIYAENVRLHLFSLVSAFSLSGAVDSGSILCGTIAESFHDCCRWVNNGTAIWVGYSDGIQCFQTSKYGLPYPSFDEAGFPSPSIEIWKVKTVDELFPVRGFWVNTSGTEVLIFTQSSILKRYFLSTPFDFRTRLLLESKAISGYACSPIPNPNGTLLYYFNTSDAIGTLGASFTPEAYSESTGWAISDRYMAESEADFPPETEWEATAEGETPAPTYVYKVIGYRSDMLYALVELADGSFAIVDVATGTPLFESATQDGQFTPVDGSGATGAIFIGDLNYHSEKLDYSETEYLDNLDGPREIEIESIFEPTPLSRGPEFLEGDKKFRSTEGTIFVVKSNGGEISVDGGETWETLDYSGLTEDADGLYTGAIEFSNKSGYVDYSTVRVRTTGEAQLKVTGLALDVEKHDRED